MISSAHTASNIPSHVWIFEGEILGILGFGLLAASWAVLPFWGADSAGNARTRLVTGAGVVMVSYLAAFTVLGYLK